MTRLSASDTAFLVQERDASHMHIGAVMILNGPPPDIKLFRRYVASRLAQIPRYRQKLAFPRYEMGRPLWIDDCDFNIDYHVRDTALPSPGQDEQLQSLIARIFSQRLDRRKPLWEMYCVEGLSNNRYALINKTHHAVVDGVAGVDLLTVLLSLNPVTEVGEPEPWHPKAPPSEGDLITYGLKEVARAPMRALRRGMRIIENPGSASKDAREALAGLGEIVRETLDSAPRTPLNTPIGQHRRYTWVRASLNDMKEIKNTFGGTVNDVVITITSDALGRWLRERHFSTEGLELRGLVPVSVRAEDQAKAGGNQLAGMRAPLPVDEMPAIKRLALVKKAMAGLKQSKQAVGAEALIAVENFAPPTILAQASRIHFSTRLFNLLVTNVPGLQVPLYVLDNEVLETFPISFLADNQALAVAVMSYNGSMNFGLIGDYDAMPDLQVIADGINDAKNELLDTAHTERAKVTNVLKSSRAATPSISKRAAKAKVAGGNGSKPASAATTAKKAAAKPKRASSKPKRAGSKPKTTASRNVAKKPVIALAPDPVNSHATATAVSTPTVTARGNGSGPDAT